MVNEQPESREFSRVPFRMVAELKTGDHELIDAGIRDVSMSGVFLECDLDIPEDADCEICLRLEGVEPPIEITLQGLVQRVVEGGIGIKFNQIPLESYEHLNHIVQLNSKNPNKSEDEIIKHIGLNPR